MTRPDFPLWKTVRGAALFVVLLPIIVPVAMVSFLSSLSRKTVRRIRRTEPDAPQLLFARKKPPLWKCSKCGKEYSLGIATRETLETRLTEMERDFNKHVGDEHPPII